jgi:hypothetical protein
MDFKLIASKLSGSFRKNNSPRHIARQMFCPLADVATFRNNLAKDFEYRFAGRCTAMHQKARKSVPGGIGTRAIESRLRCPAAAASSRNATQAIDP